MRLFIDAGHGGENLGCAYNGVVEKDFTLQAALRLEALVGAMGGGLQVVLSRRDDSVKTLAQRGEMSVGCDIVMSIHADACEGNPAAGFLSCYTVPGDSLTDAVAEEIERAAPNVLRPRTPATTLVRPSDWTQRAYNVLRPHQPRHALLVECGFLSNPKHAAYLMTTTGQAATVLALAAGVTRAWELLSATPKAA